MKRTPLFFFLCYSLSLVAQVTNNGTPVSWGLVEDKSDLTSISLPIVDIQKIKKEDEINDKLLAKPYRVGVLHTVNYGLDNGGVWTELPNGDRVWRVLFNSLNAINLSVNFNQFYIPEGGKIYLYSDDKTDLLGAYTSSQNNKNEELGTWFVKGDKIWIEYYEPKKVRSQGKLNIGSIIHGYRLGHTYQKGYLNSLEKELNDSGNCNHDVDCPIGTDFEAQRDVLKKSVAFLNLGNGFICSGTLINNTAQDKKPYLLSANHCFDESNPALYSMRFNWISPDPVCGAIINSDDSINNFTISGSTLRARNANSDVMLVEINSPIPSDWDVTYAGWDRTDITPSFVVGIHHPSGDIMKICRDNDAPVKIAQNSGEGTPIAQTWDLSSADGGWDLGVTEGGSSGSPLFNQNGYIIGQLYGGAAACSGTKDNDLHDFYGRFGVSWDDGGTAATQLKNWLDPLGTNPNTLDALGGNGNNNFEQNILIFPNPTSGILQVRIKEWDNDLTYEVYNTLGQTLLSNKLQNNEIISLNNLPSNIYFIRITEVDTDKNLVRKIVLEKE